MRTCGNCGTPVQNNLKYCDDCRERSVEEENAKVAARVRVKEDEVEDRSEIRKFLWWAFGILVVACPLLGFILGGAVVSIIFGILGLLIFCMLEQFTH